MLIILSAIGYILFAIAVGKLLAMSAKSHPEVKEDAVSFDELEKGLEEVRQKRKARNMAKLSQEEILTNNKPKL